MRYLVLLSILLTLVITACGKEASAGNPSPPPESVGNPTVGEQVFNSRHADAPSCSFCHSVDATATGRGVGPSLAGIATRAGSRAEGQDHVTYLRESIVDPAAFLADENTTNRMYQHFGDILTEQQINDLIAYLLTLK